MDDILRNIGLSSHENNIYLHLLKRGRSLAGHIAKEMKLNRSMTYTILEELIQKGLVAYVVINRKKYFMATDPEKIIDYVKEKETAIHEQVSQVSQILPVLKQLHEEKQILPGIEVFEGTEGLKSVLHTLLRETTDRYYVIGVTGKTAKTLKHFYAHFETLRMEKKIKRFLITTSTPEMIKEHYRYTEVRYLPEKYRNPLTLLIWKDKIAIRIWTGNEPLLIVLRSNDVHKAFMSYFHALWTIAKK